MRQSEFIPAMRDRIVQRFDPQQIILFGSTARGEAGPFSDIDLLVIFSQTENKRQAAIDIRRALADFPVGKDIVVATSDEIARHGELVGTVLRPALREGEVIYERK